MVWNEEKNLLLDKTWRISENKSPDNYMGTWFDNPCFNVNSNSRQHLSKSVTRQRKHLSEDERRLEVLFRFGNWRYSRECLNECRLFAVVRFAFNWASAAYEKNVRLTAMMMEMKN